MSQKDLEVADSIFVEERAGESAVELPEVT